MTTLNTPELPAVGILSNIGTDDRHLLGSYGSFHYHPAGTEVIAEGAPQEYLYIVLSGSLVPVVNMGGVSTPLRPILTGEMFGEINLFDPAEASCSIQVQENAQVWRIRRDSLEHYLEGYPAPGSVLLISITSVLARRLRTANTSIQQAQKILAGQS